MCVSPTHETTHCGMCDVFFGDIFYFFASVRRRHNNSSLYSKRCQIYALIQLSLMLSTLFNDNIFNDLIDIMRCVVSDQMCGHYSNVD